MSRVVLSQKGSNPNLKDNNPISIQSINIDCKMSEWQVQHLNTKTSYL